MEHLGSKTDHCFLLFLLVQRNTLPFRSFIAKRLDIGWMCLAKTCGELGKPINKSIPTLPDMVSAKARTHRSLPSRYGYGMKCCSPQDMDYFGFSDLQNGPKLIYPPAIKHGNGKYPIYR